MMTLVCRCTGTSYLVYSYIPLKYTTEHIAVSITFTALKLFKFQALYFSGTDVPRLHRGNISQAHTYSKLNKDTLMQSRQYTKCRPC